MKLKNINFADRYTEKIVLGAAVVYLIAVAWFFIFANPYRVELNGRSLGPDEIDAFVAQRAEQLARDLEGPAHEALRNAELPPYSALFAERLDQPLVPPAQGLDAPADALAYRAWSGNRFQLPEIDIRPPQRNPFVSPAPPAPDEAVARAGMGAIDLDGLAAEARAVLTERFGGGDGSVDAQWAAVGAELDMSAYRQRLIDPDADGRRPIPQLWIDSIRVLDVQVQRRRVLPDGSYSEPELLPPMPGRPSLRAALDEPVDATRANELLGRAVDNQRSIIAPAPYPLAVGQWLPPGYEAETPAAAEDNADQSPTDRDRAPRQRRPDPRDRRDNVPPGGYDRTPDYGDYGQGGPRERYEPRRQRPAAFEQDELDRQPTGDRQPARREAIDFRPEWGGGLLDQQTLQLWTNDFNVEPGATYQYRVRVVVSNPLFQRTQVPEAQQDLAKTFVLQGPWSGWSEPVELPKRSYFFIVGRSRELRNAEVEVWRFSRGYWRAASFQVAAGDPIGRPSGSYRTLEAVAEAAPPESVDFGVGRLVVDIDYDYPLAGQLTRQTTTRLIFTGGRGLGQSVERFDRQRRQKLADQLGFQLNPG